MTYTLLQRLLLGAGVVGLSGVVGANSGVFLPYSLALLGVSFVGLLLVSRGANAEDQDRIAQIDAARERSSGEKR